MKHLEKIERVVINNMRYYRVTQFKDQNDKTGLVIGTFPSVTSILGATSDKGFLKKWEDRIGVAKAKYITESAGKRGTVMHRLCEIYLSMPMELAEEDRLEETLKMANTDKEINEYDNRAKMVGAMLFFNFIRSKTFKLISKTRLQEQFLWSIRGGGFAGTVDNVSVLWHGEDGVIDFKTARKPKNPNQIDDYKCQVAAYAVAVFDRTGIKPKTAHILISNEAEAEPQNIYLDKDELNKYYKIFLNRLTAFYAKFPPLLKEGEVLNTELF